MAKGSVTALTLLDLSAAFDTIDHTILLDRLHVYYGISELALGWFKSYLSGRTHSVKVGRTLSHPAALRYGVPQCSVLEPILFSLYTNPIASIIHSHSSIDYPDKTEFILIGSRKKIVTNSSLTSLSIFWEIRSRQHKVSETLEWCSTLTSIFQNTCHRSSSPLEYMLETSTEFILFLTTIHQCCWRMLW